jgi:hypothetical protein
MVSSLILPPSSPPSNRRAYTCVDAPRMVTYRCRLTTSLCVRLSGVFIVTYAGEGAGVIEPLVDVTARAALPLELPQPRTLRVSLPRKGWVAKKASVFSHLPQRAIPLDAARIRVGSVRQVAQGDDRIDVGRA